MKPATQSVFLTGYFLKLFSLLLLCAIVFGDFILPADAVIKESKKIIVINADSAHFSLLNPVKMKLIENYVMGKYTGTYYGETVNDLPGGKGVFRKSDN